MPYPFTDHFSIHKKFPVVTNMSDLCYPAHAGETVSFQK